MPLQGRAVRAFGPTPLRRHPRACPEGPLSLQGRAARVLAAFFVDHSKSSRAADARDEPEHDGVGAPPYPASPSGLSRGSTVAARSGGAGFRPRSSPASPSGLSRGSATAAAIRFGGRLPARSQMLGTSPSMTEVAAWPRSCPASPSGLSQGSAVAARSGGASFRPRSSSAVPSRAAPQMLGTSPSMTGVGVAPLFSAVTLGPAPRA